MNHKLNSFATLELHFVLLKDRKVEAQILSDLKTDL